MPRGSEKQKKNKKKDWFFLYCVLGSEASKTDIDSAVVGGAGDR